MNLSSAILYMNNHKKNCGIVLQGISSQFQNFNEIIYQIFFDECFILVLHISPIIIFLAITRRANKGVNDIKEILYDIYEQQKSYKKVQKTANLKRKAKKVAFFYFIFNI